MTFIVRQILKKKIDWRYDKKGIRVCKIIIDPLLSSIKTVLRQYCDRINEKITGKKELHLSESENVYDSESEYERDMINYKSSRIYENHFSKKLCF